MQIIHALSMYVLKELTLTQNFQQLAATVLGAVVKAYTVCNNSG